MLIDVRYRAKKTPTRSAKWHDNERLPPILYRPLLYGGFGGGVQSAKRCAITNG